MSTEILLFCIVATLVTFGVVFKFALAEPTTRKRSFKSGNWGNYTNNYTNSYTTVSTPAAPLSAPRR